MDPSLSKITDFENACTRYFTQNPDAERTIVYWLQRREQSGVGSSDVNRLAGYPIGVDAKTIPRFEDKPMSHILTLDIRSAPLLAQRVPAGTRAIALFVANPDENEAFEPFSDQSEVLFINERDLAKGEYAPDTYELCERGAALQVFELEVPVEIFNRDSDELEEGTQLWEIYSGLYHAPGFAFGKPLWLQNEDHEADYLLQFDETLVNLMLGDCGIMYVFPDTAFWQCH